MSSKSATVTIVSSPSDLKAVLKLRKEIFNDELQLAPEVDQDGMEESAIHLQAKLDNKIVGCGRIRLLTHYAELERIAVLKDFRAQGIGGQLIQEMIEIVRSKDLKEARLIGQARMSRFYTRFGFVASGQPLLLDGIQHYWFVKEL